MRWLLVFWIYIRQERFIVAGIGHMSIVVFLWCPVLAQPTLRQSWSQAEIILAGIMINDLWKHFEGEQYNINGKEIENSLYS